MVRWHHAVGFSTLLMKRILSLVVALTALALPVRGADFSRFKTADELWQHIQEAQDNISPRDQTNFRQQLGNLREAAVEFEKRYDTDPRRWDAKLMRLRVDSTLADLDDKAPDLAAINAGAKQIAAAPDAAAATKAVASFFAVGARIVALDSSKAITNAAALAAVEADIAALRKNYPDDPRTAMVQFDWVNFLKLRDSAKAEVILRELAGGRNRDIAAEAQQQLEMIQLWRKLAREPLDLKFKAVDGTEVDLAKLRGKVVLVDFWATWCGPCRVEIPNVVATYNQLHKDGFEIVGISLDQDKERLLKFTKTAGMTWPQYFDGKMWKNEISTRFGVDAIPATWLVDKKGIVRSTEARGRDLGEQVKKLLAE